MDALTILLIVTGTGEYASGNLPTGLWLSELTHIYHSAEEQKYKITVASPKGGNLQELLGRSGIQTHVATYPKPG